MATDNGGLRAGQEPIKPSPGEALEAGDLIGRLKLPEEVTTQQAAAILGCCRHTILQYLEDSLLEWRNMAPPSSHRPVYRLTLRSVLELRLTYQRGGLRLPQPGKPIKACQRSTSNYQPKHLRRKARALEGNPSSAS